MKIAHYLLALLILFSCNDGSDTLTPIIGNTQSHFRDVSIGDSFKKVQKRLVKDSLLLVEAGILSSELRIKEMDLLVRYEFDQDYLYAIQADIYFTDSTHLHAFEKSLIEKYNNAYGEVVEEGGFLVWQQQKSNTEVEFTLADESFEFGQPKLSLTIYNLN